MRTADRDLPVLTEVVSKERRGQKVRVPTVVTAGLDRCETDAAGYDPYNNVPPVVDLRDPS